MIEVIQAVAEQAKKLIPPEDGSGRQVRRWRVWIATATFLNALGLSVHVMLACGFAAPFYTGFAQASDIELVAKKMVMVEENLHQKRIQELGTLILDSKRKYCQAAGDVRRLYFESMNQLRAEYFDMTKREYPDPPCSDF